MEIQSPAFQCIFKDIDTSLRPVIPVSTTYYPIHSNLIIHDNGEMEQNTVITKHNFVEEDS